MSSRLLVATLSTVAALRVLLVSFDALATSQTRIALVIGNSTYQHTSKLRNPINDARLMAQTLRELGFKVLERTDVNQGQMKLAIAEFGEVLKKAGNSAVGIFYYAGHGVQSKGINYLIPVDAKLKQESHLDIFSVNANWVLDQMEEAKSRLNLVILDACRNNPFKWSTRRGVSRGLALMRAPAGSMIAYSTRPGNIAADGKGATSPYTSALSKAMVKPGLSLSDVFIETRNDVMAATEGKQIPWEEGGLTSQFYFAEKGDNLNAVRPQISSRPKPKIVRKSGDTFKDCAVCPEMVVIPPGNFRMGDLSGDGGDNAKPVHSVAIPKPIAVGEYEVTQAEYRAVMGANPSANNFKGSRKPVEKVSLEDAQGFVRKLSVKTGRKYRLLSEAEWEYAARAGTTTKYYWGNGTGSNNANCDGCGSPWDYSASAPVGSFRSNAFGLHDMLGNVSEWVGDCWKDNYIGAPTNGSVWKEDDCPSGIIRGGSWFLDINYVHSSSRVGIPTSTREHFIGFRIARDLSAEELRAGENGSSQENVSMKCTYQKTVRGKGKPTIFPVTYFTIEDGVGQSNSLTWRQNCPSCFEQLEVTRNEYIFRSKLLYELRINRLTRMMLYQSTENSPSNFAYLYQCKKVEKKF
jgi:formylglycine-generating enzyme required for sulfatase activity